MKNTIKKIARAANRKLKKFKDVLEVNLRLPIMEVLLETQWQVEQLASAAGLKVIECAIGEEVRQRTGDKYEHDSGDAYRWGSQRGYAMFAGRKAAIDKPRARSKTTGREIELDSYRRFQQDVRLEQAVTAYQMKGYAEAKAELDKVVRYLDGLNPSAARNLEEGMEETLTLDRLGIPDRLRTSLNTTNIIESSLSRVDHLLRRVKRWNGRRNSSKTKPAANDARTTTPFAGIVTCAGAMNPSSCPSPKFIGDEKSFRDMRRVTTVSHVRFSMAVLATRILNA
jgi:hypothetical protein